MGNEIPCCACDAQSRDDIQLKMELIKCSQHVNFDGEFSRDNASSQRTLIPMVGSRSTRREHSKHTQRQQKGKESGSLTVPKSILKPSRIGKVFLLERAVSPARLSCRLKLPNQEKPAIKLPGFTARLGNGTSSSRKTQTSTPSTLGSQANSNTTLEDIFDSSGASAGSENDRKI